jgi:hypothetical protein
LDALEREWACSALANFVLEPESLQVLMENNVIKRLSERLVDTDPMVQVGAAGALRNLAVEGNEVVREEMLKKDILTPLLHLFPEAVTRLKAINSDPTAENLEKKGIISSFLEQILVILWCLWYAQQLPCNYHALIIFLFLVVSLLRSLLSSSTHRTSFSRVCWR